METTASRLQQIMRERDLRQADILQLAAPFCDRYMVKLTKSDLSQFVNGKVSPGQWKLAILGLALNVNEAWLMGYDVPTDREQKPATVSDDELLHEFIGLYRRLTKDQRTFVLAAMRGMLEKK